MDFLKVDVPVDWPQACVCGSSKGPLVATGITYRAAAGTDGMAHVYLCRMCVTRAARCMGLVKGQEHERLENADTLLAQMKVEIDERQALITQLTESLAEKDRTIATTRGYLEQLQAEQAQRKYLAEQIATNARELVGV